jgi:integrase
MLMEAIRKPAPGKPRDRRLRAGELAAVLAATDSPVLPALARLAVATAARLGELLALTWADVDLHRRVAVVRYGKNGESRGLPLSAAALEVLSALPRSIDGGPVFKGTSSHGVTVAWLRAVKRSRQRYETDCTTSGNRPEPEHLTGLHFHDLRHEGVSALFERGLNQIEVATVSGHKTLNMLRRYTHLKAADLALKLA